MEIQIYKELQLFMGLSEAQRSLLPLLDEGAEPPTPWMALPYVPGPNLRRILQANKLCISVRTVIVTQLAEVLQWLHGWHLCHLDIKPGNMLWNPYCCNLVLIDFGMALLCKENGTPVNDIQPFNAVTANYRPPELWKSKVTNDTVCAAIDVWCFGCTMIEVYAQQMLMPGSSQKQILAAVELWVRDWHNKTGHACLIDIPKHLRNVAWFCMAPEPSFRPKMQGNVADWALSLPRCPMKT